MAETRLRPIWAILIVFVAAAGLLAADWALSGGLRRSEYIRVSPDENGIVAISLSDFDTNEVRFYRFLNAGNQEVKFLVGLDTSHRAQVGFDAGESHYKLHRGFRAEDGWIVDNKCDSTSRLEHLNDGGSGCKPVPLPHRVEDDTLILTEGDILRGWRYFR